MSADSCCLSRADFNKIQSLSTVKTFKAGDCIFTEGDMPDYVYFIESGKVSIFIEKFNVKEELHVLGAGECFGEMAVLLNNKRTASASAVEDTTFFSLDKKDFLSLIRTDRGMAAKINSILAQRNEELILRETLISSAGLDAKNLHVSIKGDPSLRETALFRERYESAVDKVLPQLSSCLEELLLRRCVYQVFIGFNSGEIRTASLLNPFTDEIHQVRKLLDEAYVDRHFPSIDYLEKAAMLRQLYQAVKGNSWFNGLAGHLQNIWGGYYDDWHPVPAEEISRTISSLPTLRSIQNFYLRNVTISMVRDAIHMQFNCDGTHIVSAEDYERFLEENL